MALTIGLMGAAPNVTVEVYPETVRWDLDTGRVRVAERDGVPQDRAAYRLPDDPVTLRAVRDETIAVQIWLQGPAGSYPVSGAHLEGPDRLPIDVFVAQKIRVKASSASDFVYSLGPGTYADPLVPTATVALEASGTLVWLDVYVPRDAKAGAYAGTLRFGSAAHVKLSLTVHDLTLPERDVARLGSVNFGSFRERFHQDPQRMLAWMQLAHAHHLSVEYMRPTPKVKDDGTIDWAGWAREVGPYVDGTAFTAAHGYRGPRAGLPTTRMVMPLTDWWPVPAKDNLPSDPARWSSALKAWETFVVEQGWLSLPHPTRWFMFINSLDEPKRPEQIDALMAYGPLIEAAQLEDRTRFDFRVDGNFGQRIKGYNDRIMARELGKVVDVWNVHGAPYTIPWPVVSDRRRYDGERMMVYASNSGGEPSIPPVTLDSPLEGLRAWGWLSMRYDLEGVLNWEIDHWDASCRVNPRCSPGKNLNLDATLIYRGEAMGLEPGRPIPSIRLKALRRGAQDVALLSLLKDRGPKTRDLVLATVLPRALGHDVPATGRGAWSLHPRVYDYARDAMLDQLIRAPNPRALKEIRIDAFPLWVWSPERWFGAAAIGAVGVIGLLWLVLRRKAV